MITYEIYNKDLDIAIGEGFFKRWPNPPSQAMHKQILEGSFKAIVAVDEERKKIIGFINAISDGILSAYIPLLEVLSEYQNQGIGAELVKRMLEELKDFYMIDLICDEELQSYYKKLGMMKAHGMLIRNYEVLYKKK